MTQNFVHDHLSNIENFSMYLPPLGCIDELTYTALVTIKRLPDEVTIAACHKNNLTTVRGI